MKPTGFMSEHTAEYALVHDLTAHIAERFPRVIPMCFWSTREGARIAEESMRDRRVRVLAAYARRPKVFRADQRSILVKVNAQLFAGAAEGISFGIPVLVGVPLVSSLATFSIGVPCCWFRLLPSSELESDYEFAVPVSEEGPVAALDPRISGPLTRVEITDLVAAFARGMSWAEAAEGMRAIRRAGAHYAPSPFAQGYRPFFLVILD